MEDPEPRDLTDDDHIAIAKVQLAIEETIRLLDESIEEWVADEDRAIAIYHLSLAYIQGYEDAIRDAKLT